jgi:hypothetical protein
MSHLSQLSPPVLFFVLGMIASLVKSNLRVPKAVTKLLSLYLLWAIGFKGGVKIAAVGMDAEALTAIGLGIGLSIVAPIVVFALLRARLGSHTAAAVAATYGSVSAVTFLTATSILETQGVPYGGYMVAVMALMESPAIAIAVLLLRRAERGTDAQPLRWSVLLHDAFLNGPVLLLLGSLAIGMITQDRGYDLFKPAIDDLFNGVLVFFLLDLGIIAARRLRAFLGHGIGLVGFGVAFPLVAAAITIALAAVCGLSAGNAVLLATLAASGSYIAVPAACRIAIPKAEPSIYIGLALAVTFPFNVIIGIPLYLGAVRLFWPS